MTAGEVGLDRGKIGKNIFKYYFGSVINKNYCTDKIIFKALRIIIILSTYPAICGSTSCKKGKLVSTCGEFICWAKVKMNCN